MAAAAKRLPGLTHSPWEELFIVYNASAEAWAFSLPEPEGQGGMVWEVLADGREADCRRLAEPGKELLAEACSGMLLGGFRRRTL